MIQPSRFEAVKEALTELGVEGMTISDVRGHGRQKGHTEVYRGREYTVDLVPKIKIEMVLADNLVNAAVDAIVQSAGTGKIGDGKIFLSKIDEAIGFGTRSAERRHSNAGPSVRPPESDAIAGEQRDTHRTHIRPSLRRYARDSSVA